MYIPYLLTKVYHYVRGHRRAVCAEKRSQSWVSVNVGQSGGHSGAVGGGVLRGTTGRAQRGRRVEVGRHVTAIAGVAVASNGRRHEKSASRRGVCVVVSCHCGGGGCGAGVEGVYG